jgi:hypothetical protein
MRYEILDLAHVVQKCPLARRYEHCNWTRGPNKEENLWIRWAIRTFSIRTLLHGVNHSQWHQPIIEPQRICFFFCSRELPCNTSTWVKDPRGPLQTRFLSIQVPFKAGFTVVFWGCCVTGSTHPLQVAILSSMTILSLFPSLLPKLSPAYSKRTDTFVSIFGHECLSHMLCNFFFVLFFAPHGRRHACLSLKACIMVTVLIGREAGHRCWLAGWNKNG